MDGSSSIRDFLRAFEVEVPREQRMWALNLAVEPQRCPFLSPNFTSFHLSFISYRLKRSIGMIKVTLIMHAMTDLLYFCGFFVIVIFDQNYS